MSKTYLQLPEDFNYELNFELLMRSPRELLHNTEGDHVIKLVKVGDEKVLFRIRQGTNKLILEFLNGDPSVPAAKYVKQYIQEWFDLKTDLSPFYELASKDKLLAPLITKFKGYRIIGQPDLFESIIWAVLGQQINLQFAYTLKSRF